MRKIFIFGDEQERKNYAEAINLSGGQAVISTNLSDSRDCDGLLLPGGGDIAPWRYGAENLGSVGIDEALDETELALVKNFAAQNRPILGICRGCQLINVAFGGSLIQDLPTAAQHKWTEQTGDQAHFVTAAEGSFLQKLYGNRFRVNSAHHQAAGRIAEGFTVSAQSDDGVIEAIECVKKNIYAVQFHPERMSYAHRRPDTVDGRSLFEWFLNLC